MSDLPALPEQLHVSGTFVRRERSTFDSLYATFPGAQVWREWFFAPRDRDALFALGADPDFDIHMDLIRTNAWIVLARQRLMMWSRKGRTLSRFAALPQEALRVDGKQWDTPNLIVSVHPNSGEAQQLAFSPDDGQYKWRRNVVRAEDAYRRAAAWIGAPSH